jgi:hypothetical protein
MREGMPPDPVGLGPPRERMVGTNLGLVRVLGETS